MIITRFHDVEKMNIIVEFLTPTFLGGADQQGELRGPPFKNLMRQWWRVVNGNLSENELRCREGMLFGTVLGDGDSTASKVRISIVPSQELKLTDAPFQFGKTKHPEVKGGMAIENSLYLGYGPIRFAKPQPVPKRYIAPNSKATLSIVYPQLKQKEIFTALQYMDAFGAIGSRCRNGFGSISLTAEGLNRLEPATLTAVQFQTVISNNKEYPNAFGRDSKGLLAWDSSQFTLWSQAMQLLAGTYLTARTAISIAGNGLRARHALGYPVTNHSVREWDGNLGRMPSQLRLMVKRNQQNQLVARILHLPHKLPKQWPSHLPPQPDVWRQVHGFLDGQKEFHRIGGGA